ncbi:MAG TPA: hypothetical protein VKU41_08820, partial [Polyangiaceae bacterium]|nr:hypothetical protein [Polyangiaceae bacterium]
GPSMKAGALMKDGWRSVTALAGSKYAAPSAAAIGLAALATTAIAMRHPVARILRGVARFTIAAGHTVGGSMRADRLLAIAGLQPRRPFMTAGMPIVAGITGMVAGSVLTLWLAKPGSSDARPREASSSLNSTGLDSRPNEPPSIDPIHGG